MSVVLCVAEKPSIAQGLARILGTPSRSGGGGRKQRLPVYEVDGSFEGRSCVYRVTSVAGHVYSVDFPDAFQNWKTTDPATLFSAPVVKKAEGKVCKHLQQEAKGCDRVILWLDNDREGENICFEVLENVLPHLGRPSHGKRVLRAKFSALTDEDVRRAMSSLCDPNEAEARAVDARQELDLKIGVAWTRFQTQYFDQRYGDLDSRLISYGPCQTPTLGFCVARHDEICRHVPEKYWAIHCEVNVEGAIVSLQWKRGRLFNQSVASVVLKSLQSERFATVEESKKKPSRKQRPVALNTVELLRVCSKQMGIGPQQTMHMAEQLYVQGYISYPRTESTAYPKSFDFHAALRPHQNHDQWGVYVQSLLQIGLENPRPGNDVGDHPPIVPTRSATESELGGNLYRVYEYVARHFLATISPDCTYDKLKVVWRVGTETFSSSTVDVKRDGYTLILPQEAVQSTITAAAAPQVGSRYNIADLRLREGETEPPSYLTESELITLMEEAHIGTDASIPVHINNICERNFCKVTGHARMLVPTLLGISLIHGISRIDKQLCGPVVRSQVEKYLDSIAVGEASFDEVVKHTLNIFVDKFNFFRDNISRMDELFEASFSNIATTAATSKSLSRCGRCRKYMRLIHKQPARLFCEFCNETYNLPPGGSIKLYQERTCPLDGFELVLWRSGQGEQAKSAVVCPMCYNHPPLENWSSTDRKGMSCSFCTIPTCENSMVRTAVMGCNEEKCDGTVLLDPVSAPKWKMACNKCNYCIFLPEGAKKISLSSDKCIECGTTIMTVDFNKNNIPKELNGVTLRKGCPQCDEIINNACHEGHTKATFGKRKNFGRKGKKGGGGGGGGKKNDPKLTFHGF